jgi:hypothetical protein
VTDTKSLKTVRDARIDELKAAFTSYVDKEIARQEKVVELLEQILEAHGTSTAATKTVIDEISVLAETKLSKFLTG